jgi:hypothetical protein
MGAGGDVGEGELVARQPAPPVGEPGDVLQMDMEIGIGDADRLGIRLPAAHQPLHDLLFQQPSGHLAIEFEVEPADEAAHLGPGDGIAAEQGRLGIDLVEIFGDGLAVGDDSAMLVHQHRHLAAGIEMQQLVAPLAGALVDEIEGQVLLPEQDPQLAGEGIEGEVVEAAHGAAV